MVMVPPPLRPARSMHCRLILIPGRAAQTRTNQLLCMMGVTMCAFGLEDSRPWARLLEPQAGQAGRLHVLAGVAHEALEGGGGGGVG